MRSLLVVGKGITGKATATIFNNNVDFHDPYKDETVSDCSNYCYAFLCVPTPENGDGQFDCSQLDNAVVDLLKKGFQGILVVRSTCDPDNLKRLSEVYEKFIYWPEFLREKHYLEDALNPDNVVIGGQAEYTDEFTKLLKQNKHKLLAFWKTTDITTASIIKLGLNSALAAKIAMFNSIRDVCEITGANWETVKSVISNDSRIGEGQTLVPGPDKLRGFGGKCLPKDLKVFSSLAKENVYLNSILQYNNKVRN